MRIEVLYVPGCPNYEPAVERLQAVLESQIKFVADMDKAVKFHRDVLGLKVKFESPGWSEFVKGRTTRLVRRI